MKPQHRDVLLDWEGYSVKATASYVIENNGIGPYEFWGAKGFDRGQDCILVEELLNVQIQNPRTTRFVPVAMPWLLKHNDRLCIQAERSLEEIVFNEGPDVDIPPEPDDYPGEEGE